MAGPEIQRLRSWASSKSGRLRFARSESGKWYVSASRDLPSERAGMGFSFEVDDQESPEAAAAVLWGYLSAIGEEEPNPRGS